MHCITLLFTILLNNLKKNLHDTTPLENFGDSIEKKLCLSEHKVRTLKQQFLAMILWFFMYLKWPWLLRFFAKML